MRYSTSKTLKWTLVKQLSNLNFSISLLLIIAIVSILGTIIEQDKSIKYYQLNYPIQNNIANFVNWKTIMFYGINHIYTNWWFLCLLFIFFCSLITCTFSKQLPSLRNARNWKFMPYNQKNNHNTIILPLQSLTNIIYSLIINKYYVFQKADQVYGYKGLIGRIAPIFVHISLVMTLVGSIIGLFSGFTAQQMIPNKETFHIQNMIKSGLYSHIPYNTLGKIENFFIEYNTNNSIKQFYSQLTLMNNQGECLINKLISVNSPLKFHGLTFYQTAWNINALKIRLDNKIIQQPLKETTIGSTRIWIYTLKLKQDHSLFFIFNGLKDKISIYNSSGQLIKTIVEGETFKVKSHSITIVEIMTSTGIQIKTDPGIPVVYSGFFTLIISITISYLSYSQVWTKKNALNIEMKGITNRGQLSFEEELITLQKQYTEFTQAKNSQ
uniref:Cytochrome c biogenesis protein CcsB n=1 Tax=Eucheuma denticulatum TaxID=305493 RepID=A0A8E7PGI3_9FLOR|nr:c-type cytochrome biogenesis protein [Eucheuma denticulatum]